MTWFTTHNKTTSVVSLEVLFRTCLHNITCSISNNLIGKRQNGRSRINALEKNASGKSKKLNAEQLRTEQLGRKGWRRRRKPLWQPMKHRKRPLPKREQSPRRKLLKKKLLGRRSLRKKRGRHC